MSFSDYLCLISDQGPWAWGGVVSPSRVLSITIMLGSMLMLQIVIIDTITLQSVSTQVFSAQMLALGHLNISYQDKDSSRHCYHINNFTVIIDCAG